MATYDDNPFDGDAGLGPLTHELKAGLLDAMDVAKGAAGIDAADTELGMDTYTHFTALAIYKFVKAFIETNLEMTGELVDDTVAHDFVPGSAGAALTTVTVSDTETKSTEFTIDEEFDEDPALGEVDQFGRKKAE